MDSDEKAAARATRWGYPLRTSSDACVAAIDAYFEQVLSYGRKRAVILEAPVQDPSCVLGNTLAAHLLASHDAVKSSALLAAAAAGLGNATSYEKAVYEAILFLVGDGRDEKATLNPLFELVKEYPKDLVALKRAQVLCFCMGQPSLSLSLVEQALPQNQDQSFIYGMLAFPLLELGRMAEAETAARRGWKINRFDFWSQHCLCHVLQYDCRFKEAVEFMESCSSTWSSCSSFMYTHNWWHVAICYLEGNAPLCKVLEVYDQKIWKELQRSDSDRAEVLLNALGLLLRLDIRGQIHAFRDRVVLATETLKDKLAEATYEYSRGNHRQVIDILGPDFDAVNFKMIGASDEQLDVFNEIWYNVLLSAGHVSKAIDQIEKQLKKREGCPYLWRLLEKAYQIDGGGNAGLASEKAKTLELSYFN